MRVFQNTVLSIMLGAKRDEATGNGKSYIMKI
jgi:hypothetical protein